MSNHEGKLKVNWQVVVLSSSICLLKSQLKPRKKPVHLFFHLSCSSFFTTMTSLMGRAFSSRAAQREAGYLLN
jgi:hypothetical protein